MNAYLLFASILLPLAAGGILWASWARRPRLRRTRLQPRDVLPRDGQAMYLRLRAALPQYIIFARASLAAFVEVRGASKAAVGAREAELASQTVDFLICSGDFRVVAAVELDDVVRGRRDHERGSALLREAAIPVLRWTTASLPTIRDIQEAVAEVETLRLIRSGLSGQPRPGMPQERRSLLGRREPRL